MMTEQEAIKDLKDENEECLRLCEGACSSIENYQCNCHDAVIERMLDELLQYRAIGTVEECREAREKQMPKKCYIDSCPDHAHYKCPSCGQIQMSTYTHGFPRLGRITKCCENCGQALVNENLEGMRND